MTGKYKDKMPCISEDCFIAENAVVIGDVTLKNKSSVWFGAVIRGDDNCIEIGEGSNIQDNATVHVAHRYPVEIGDYVTVGHNSVIHGCTIENDVLIGMGATILNGAHIGKGSIIGAGALVRENTVIPPYSLVVGVPGKIKGTVTNEQQEHIRHNAMEYVTRGCEYREAGYGQNHIRCQKLFKKQ